MNPWNINPACYSYGEDGYLTLTYQGCETYQNAETIVHPYTVNMGLFDGFMAAKYVFLSDSQPIKVIRVLSYSIFYFYKRLVSNTCLNDSLENDNTEI